MSIRYKELPEVKQKSLFSRIISGRSMVAALGILLGVALGLGVSQLVSKTAVDNSFYLPNRLQAVFLDNGNVLFGKISGKTDSSLILENVYYLKSQSQNGVLDSSTAKPIQEQELSTGELTLVRISDDIHAPDNQAEIQLAKVILIQNLSASSPIAKTINNR